MSELAQTILALGLWWFCFNADDDADNQSIGLLALIATIIAFV